MRYNLDQLQYYTIGSDTLRARITNYGCTLLNLWVTDNTGAERDIVLGYEDIEDYFDNPPCFGSCVLPNANRIAGAQFSLNGCTYILDKNDGDNNLHSGNEPLHKRLWGVETVENSSVTFVIGSEDGDCGFPGNREYTVTYSIDDNRLRIDYSCISDKDTLFNPTNHSYFNLSGHDAGSVLDHKLTINADTFTPSDEHSICHGDIKAVAGTPMDFTTPTKIGERIDADYDQLKWGNGYDHNYCVKGTSPVTQNTGNADTDAADTAAIPAATLTNEAGDLTLNIYTTASCLQLYTGNYISKEDIGKGNHPYAPRCGVALETQFAPNAINTATLEPPILKKGVLGTSTTEYELVVGKC